MSKMTIQEKLRGLADGKRYRDSAGNCYGLHKGVIEDMFKVWLSDLEEIKELDWSADEHDPELIEDLWPVECWDDRRPYKRDNRFFSAIGNCTIIGMTGDRAGNKFNHYRVILRDQWTKWQEEKYNELKERYYGD